VYELLVVVHVVAAAVWVGGVVALTLVAVPVAQRQEDAGVRGALLRDFGRRWRPLGWGALGVAILTGIPVAERWNAFDPDVLLDTRFGRLLLLKSGLVVLLVALSTAHARLGPVLARQIREGREQTARAPLVLVGRASFAVSVLVLVIAVLLRR
jgi:copper resistance protein D